MILLVPASPEVPRHHLPRLWQGLVFMLVLAIFYLQFEKVLERDKEYVDGILTLTDRSSQITPTLGGNPDTYLALRPLLQIAPAPGSWDIPRMVLANFVHGSPMHLFLNMIGAFAGARICATFVSFFWTLFLFLLGGTLGLWASILIPSETGQYVPHVGASAGIFALMGMYYVYNFKFRTRYFFWFPTRHGLIALPTSWFFFFDVLLLELVLSAGQLFPMQLDGVDHVAHVVGFACGVGFALMLRMLQRWPEFIHTRGELLFWKSLARPKNFNALSTPLQTWLKCLEINPYNDRIKVKVLAILKKSSPHLTETEIASALHFVSPVFGRRSPAVVAEAIRSVLRAGKLLPPDWMRKTPYDVVIRIARQMAGPAENQLFLYRFIEAYRGSLPTHIAFDHKIELLLSKLGAFMPQPPSAKPAGEYQVGTDGNASGAKTPHPTGPRSPDKRARGAP